jgi:hypothetical protein
MTHGLLVPVTVSVHTEEGKIMRKKLIDLLMDKPFGRATEEEETEHIEDLADYLIDNGVAFPVHCKECVYNENGCCTHSENYDDTKYRPDYFCADGERR